MHDLVQYQLPPSMGEEKNQLEKLKKDLGWDELLYLSTCNRVLFLIISEADITDRYREKLFPRGELNHVKYFHADAAVLHLFEVAASIHSLVVGEQEILKQIRDAYEKQAGWSITGDNIRLAIQHTVRTAKKIYANTRIAEKPVSVVSLAVKQLMRFKLSESAKFILIGAGGTTGLVLKHLRKKGFANFHIYNRTLANAQVLAEPIGAVADGLSNLGKHTESFDCLIACTSSPKPIVDDQLLHQLTNGTGHQKVWVDLGVPGNLSSKVQLKYPDRHIGIESLKILASENLKFRRAEVKKASRILQEAVESFQQLIYRRRIELAFQRIPREIKSVKNRAISEVFRRDLENLDPDARLVIEKMMDYMEKKCIGIPMKAAKDAAL